ncbi:MAG: hypothetical protein ACP5HG_12030 [Anaerolineae bacterium]
MPTRHPIQYQLEPETLSQGVHWVTARLKNVGTQGISDLNVTLNSRDSSRILIYGQGNYLAFLAPEQEEAIPFQLSANATTSVYIAIDGQSGTEPFQWESPYITLRIGQEQAELVHLFAMTEPYPPVGKRIRCEATIRGLTRSRGLRLEFWADTPDNRFEKLGVVETKELEADEEATYAAEITPRQEGLYTLYAYLYDEERRIGREMEQLYVVEQT